MRRKLSVRPKTFFWFAWYPVRTVDRYLVWLEWVRCTRVDTYCDIEYTYELDPATTPWRN